MYRVVTGVVNWIHYNNPDGKKKYVKPAKSTGEPNIMTPVFDGIGRACCIMSFKNRVKPLMENAINNKISN